MIHCMQWIMVPLLLKLQSQKLLPAGTFPDRQTDHDFAEPPTLLFGLVQAGLHGFASTAR
jgi:hypothetical protein